MTIAIMLVITLSINTVIAIIFILNAGDGDCGVPGVSLHPSYREPGRAPGHAPR